VAERTACSALDRTPRDGRHFGDGGARVARRRSDRARSRQRSRSSPRSIAPTRDGQRWPAPVDVRSALARIGASIEGLRGSTSMRAGRATTSTAPAGLPRRSRARSSAARQERERYAFFSAVGHELRTPLASIRGYLETLLGRRRRSGDARALRGIAHGESLRLTRLLEGMFEISLLDLSATFPPAASGRSTLRSPAPPMRARAARASAASTCACADAGRRRSRSTPTGSRWC
jgi:signal transduction histidine kinase